MKKAIIWFRSDLRIHDNEAFVDALHCADMVYPVYVFDPRVFKGNTSFGFRKTGKHRTRFIIESILDLKEQLKKMGSDLIIRSGFPENEIFELARTLKTSWIFCNRERTAEEVRVQDNLEKNLWTIGQEIRFSRGKMLYYTADLPFPITHTPDTFTGFRKEVERFTTIRKPLPKIEKPLNPIPKAILIDSCELLLELGYQGESKSYFQGGERIALKRLRQVLDHSLTDGYKNRTSTNGIVGLNLSTKLSPWVSLGCLSTKTFYWEVKKYEKLGIDKSTSYQQFIDLMRRDYYRLMGKKHGNKIFQAAGIHGKIRLRPENRKLFDIWKSGKTGVPVIDACMRELNQTGYLSQQGRTFVASYLIHNLNINWILGAEYFESILLDYDPCSNYCNWQHLAGAEKNSRSLYIRSVKAQAKKVDANGDYVRYWVPELANIPGKLIHTPENLDSRQLHKFQIDLGVDYPYPIACTEQSVS